MKIVFDTDACKKMGKDVDVILYLISIAAGSKITQNTYEKARVGSLLKFKAPYDRRFPFADYVELSKEGEFLVDSIMADSNAGAKNSDERFTILANKLRDLFPAGKKPGYSIMWRDSTSCIADRLKKFFFKYGEYSDSEIIDATKRYIASFNGDYRYMQTLRYFIWKNKVSGAELIDGRMVGEVEKQSQLASYLENKDTDVPQHIDWEVELK